MRTAFQEHGKITHLELCWAAFPVLIGSRCAMCSQIQSHLNSVYMGVPISNFFILMSPCRSAYHARCASTLCRWWVSLPPKAPCTSNNLQIICLQLSGVTVSNEGILRAGCNPLLSM